MYLNLVVRFIFIYLYHGQKIAEETAEDPVPCEQDQEGDGHDDNAHKQVTEGEVDEVAKRLILVEAVAEDDVHHETIGKQTDNHDHGVQEDEQRVQGDKGIAELGPAQVDSFIVWYRPSKIVGYLLQIFLLGIVHVLGIAAIYIR